MKYKSRSKSIPSLRSIAYGGLDIEQPDSLSEWAERFFYIPETDGPIWFNPRQRAAIEQATARDENGMYLYTNVLIGDVKKSGKTTIVACKVLHEAVTNSHHEIKIVGNDLKQAQSRVFKYVERAISLAKAKDANCHPMIKTADVIRNYIRFENGSIIEAVPVDPRGEAGGNDDLVVFTELWGANTDAHSMMWTETVIPPLKYGMGQRWVDSYAGYVNDSPLLWSLYESTVIDGSRLHDEYPFYVDSSGLMFTMWNHKPDLPWQTDQYYEQQRNELTPNEFERIHRNRWVERVEVFVDQGTLDDCTRQPPVLSGELFCAVDAAVDNDFCAIVVIRYNRSNDMMDVVYEKTFQPIGGQPIDVIAFERHLYETIDRYRPVKTFYDPYQMERTAQGYRNPSQFEKFNQGVKRNLSDASLQKRLLKRKCRFAHGGELYLHLMNANAENKAGKLRIVKRSGGKKKSNLIGHVKIDLAVALSMAAYGAETSKGTPQQPRVGSYRGTRGGTSHVRRGPSVGIPNIGM